MKNLIWGILLILIGIIIGGNAFGIININIFFDGWWTLFIIIPSFIGLFKENKRIENIIGLIIGIILLLLCQGIIDFYIISKLLVPGILVGIGIFIIIKNTLGEKTNQEIKRLNENKKSQDEYCVTFSSQDVRFDNEECMGADLTAVFGALKCDLSKAIIKSDIVINLSSIFAGIDIYVPENVKVKIKSTSIFGGVSDEKKHCQNVGEYTIYINATCLFGGVEVK